MVALTLVAAASIGAFVLVFWLAGVVPAAKGAIATMQNAVGAMRDPALDELARERAVQSAAVRLLVAAGSLILRSLLALAAAFVPILAADMADVVPQAASLAFLERWEVILIATLVIVLGYGVGSRVWSR